MRNKILVLFEDFANECEYYDTEDYPIEKCLHPGVLGEGCLSSSCPLVGLASLADIKKLDPGLYEELLPEYKEKLTTGYGEVDCFPLDSGADWCVVDK